MQTMDADEVGKRLRELPGWEVDGPAIRREFVFAGFADAIAFIVRIGFTAEAADHHPDIALSNYKKVKLTFTTHSAAGLTTKDFVGAAAADRAFR